MAEGGGGGGGVCRMGTALKHTSNKQPGPLVWGLTHIKQKKITNAGIKTDLDQVMFPEAVASIHSFMKSIKAYLMLQMFEILYLLSERFFGETIHKSHHSVWKIMLSQPGYYFIMLKIWSGCDVHDQITQLLPISVKKRILQ